MTARNGWSPWWSFDETSRNGDRWKMSEELVMAAHNARVRLMMMLTVEMMVPWQHFRVRAAETESATARMLLLWIFKLERQQWSSRVGRFWTVTAEVQLKWRNEADVWDALMTLMEWTMTWFQRWWWEQCNEHSRWQWFNCGEIKY